LERDGLTFSFLLIFICLYVYIFICYTIKIYYML
jgi:hypothetical protein